MKMTMVVVVSLADVDYRTLAALCVISPLRGTHN